MCKFCEKIRNVNRSDGDPVDYKLVDGTGVLIVFLMKGMNEKNKVELDIEWNDDRTGSYPDAYLSFGLDYCPKCGQKF